MKDIFNANDVNTLVSRINTLEANSLPHWGKMAVGQMLAHCNVTYEMVYDNIHPAPNAFVKFILKTFVKPAVVGNKPYKKNGRTAPQFLITDTKDFENEKARLINYIEKTKDLGAHYFDGKLSHSFGKLTTQEWNTMFYKHLDHHLNQFGV